MVVYAIQTCGKTEFYKYTNMIYFLHYRVQSFEEYHVLYKFITLATAAYELSFMVAGSQCFRTKFIIPLLVRNKPSSIVHSHIFFTCVVIIYSAK